MWSTRPGCAVGFDHSVRSRVTASAPRRIRYCQVKMTKDEVADREAIDSQRARWINAINASDAAGFAAILCDDAVWLPWGLSAISGKESIRDWLAEPFAQFTYDYSVTDVGLRMAGDWAIERAHFVTKARSHEGHEAPVHRGTYTIRWRRTPAEAWLIERYIDHTGDEAV